MKTKLFLGLAAVAIMTSCSNDETIDMVQPNAIGFENAFVNNSTRATDIVNSNFESFALYGFVKDATGVLFENEKVSKGDPTWTYTNIQYWTPGENHWFTGIAPYDDRNWTFAPVEGTATEYNGGGTLTFDNKTADGEEDLIHVFSGAKSIAQGATSAAPIQLTFNHLLSRVKFTFKNIDTNNNITFQVTDVKITDAYANGVIDMNVVAPEWETTNKTYSPVFGDAANGTTVRIPVNETLSTDHKYLIPATAATNYTVTFTAVMRTGEVTTATQNFTTQIPNIEMKKGSSYNLTAELKGSTMGSLEIKFTASVGDWEDWTNAPTLPDSTPVE